MATRDLTIGFRVSDQFIADNPNVDASAVELGINLMAVSELASSRMESVLAPFGLRKGGFNLLMVLAGAESPITPTQIGERLVLRGATITGIVDTLVRRGFAERAADPSDRRRVLVSITPQGRDVVADASAVIFRNDEEVMAIFTQAERERLIRMLGRLQNHLKQLTD
jgi:DNA-binding MarR family transcriptional regulator